MIRFGILFSLLLLPLAIQAGEMRFEDNNDGELTVYEGDDPVLVYNYGIQTHPDAPDRKRSTYVHPVYNIDGTVMTDDFPRDHYHHRGIFWTWQRVFWKDREYDFWTLRQDNVRQLFDEWMYRKAEDGTVSFGVDNGWYIGDECIVDEKIEFVVHPAEDKGRAIDISLSLQATGEDVGLLGAAGKGYSGMGVRFADHKNTRIATSSGLHTQDIMRLRSRWADYSGQINGEDYHGITVMAAPDLPDYPPAWFLRHYGYFGVCWPSLNLYTLKKEDPPVVRNYRVWVHTGHHETGGVQEAFDQYHANY